MKGARADVAEKTNLSDPSLYKNRELSWLGFNERVLARARDELFMIRAAGLQQQGAAELPNLVPERMTPEEQPRCKYDHTGRRGPLDSQALLLEEPF